jgi:tetratricopeptide (TPR) repeat protein
MFRTTSTVASLRFRSFAKPLSTALTRGVWLTLCVSVLSGSWGCSTLRPGAVADNVVAARQLSLQGIAAMHQEDWLEAERLFAAAIETNPSDERAHRRYAELLWRRNMHESAIEHLEKSARLSGGDPELLVQLGGMYLDRGDLDTAWRRAESAITANRQLACAWALRGDILRARGEPQPALVSYHRALCYQPHFPNVQIAVADLYSAANRPRRALATLSSLLDNYEPDKAPPDILLRQGLVLKSLGRYDDAIDALKMASRSDSANIDVLYHLSESHWLAGDVANAGVAIQVALARDPNHVPSQRLQSEIRSWQRSMTADLRPGLSGS